MIDKKDLLKLVTEEAVIKIMEENGSPLYDTSVDGRTGQRCLWFQTICHGGDSHKLCFFTESKDFYCYTNCGRMGFFEFIKRIRNAKDEEFYSKVIVYIAQKVGKSLSRNREGFSSDAPQAIREELRYMEDVLDFKARRKAQKEQLVVKTYDARILNYFDHNTFYKGWIDEGISIQAMQKFNICWYEFQKYIIIPHYNIKGELVGIRRRSLKEEDKKNKYMPIYLEGESYDHALGLNLYGLYENQEAIKRKRQAVIVEGEKSVLQSETYFGKESCAVATCGFNISDWQITALLKLGVEEVYLGFDKDYDDRYEEVYKADEGIYRGYSHYQERLISLAQRLAPYCEVYLLKDRKGLLDIKDSPFDKRKSAYQKLLRDKVRVNTFAG